MQLVSYFTLAITLLNLAQAIPLQRRADARVTGVAYTGRNSDGSCQSTEQVRKTIDSMSRSGIHRIRTYAQQCDLLTKILQSIDSVGADMTVLAAVWIDGSSNDDAEIATLKNVLETADHTGAIDAVLVGNEVLYNGVLSSGALIKKMDKVRSIARGVPVGTVEIPESYSQDLIDASDIVGTNIQPFYAQVNADQAMENVRARFDALQERSGGKEVLVTEVGWPTKGGDVGPAHPSIEAEAALASAMSESGISYYFFEWQDASWKGSSAESHFGLLDASGEKKLSF